MQLAIISDTHLPKGSRSLPEACRRRLAAADAILHAGDFIKAEVLADLRGLGPPVHAVHGNVDCAELRAELPESTMLEFGETRIAMIHNSGSAAGRSRRMRNRFPDADAVIFGHSHIPLLERGPDGLILFNPGSPTERRRAPSHTMGIAKVADGQIHFKLVVLD